MTDPGAADDARPLRTTWQRGSRCPQEGTATLGVAISVPAPYAGRLREERVRSGDPLATVIPPHITVVPPLRVAPALLDEVDEHLLATVAERPRFQLVLSGTGTFRPVSEVSFVRVIAGVPECVELQEHVRTGPLARPLQFAYHPHVTVAHDVPAERLDAVEAALAEFEASFEVSDITLYVCGDDGVWRPRLDAPLASPVAAAGR